MPQQKEQKKIANIIKNFTLLKIKNQNNTLLIIILKLIILK